MGRRAGSLKDYPYSEALKSANFTWTREKMFEWLGSPHEAMPDTKMMFAGIKGFEERDEVVKFLGQYKAN